MYNEVTYRMNVVGPIGELAVDLTDVVEVPPEGDEVLEDLVDRWDLAIEGLGQILEEMQDRLDIPKEVWQV